MSLHLRPDGDRFIPQHLAEAIGRAWGKIAGKRRAKEMKRIITVSEQLPDPPTLLPFVTVVARLKADAGEIILAGIRIYETKTVQRFLNRKFSS